jgi:hypothetical protein
LAESYYEDGWRHARDYWRSIDSLSKAENVYPFDHRFREAPEQRAAGWVNPR